MDENIIFENTKKYFEEKLNRFGAHAKGVDFNSAEAQEIRFEQIMKLVRGSGHFSIIDYGCGYGALYDYLKKQGYDFDYLGYDISEKMIEKAIELHKDCDRCVFASDEGSLASSDYIVANAIFNNKQNVVAAEWESYFFRTLEKMNKLSVKGFSFNTLTKYSDADRMRPDLYYPDPCKVFDYCMTNFSRSVALLHDYGLYDFTIIVRK